MGERRSVCADDNNDAALFEKIKTGRYDADDPLWENVSDGAKDLVAKMLTVDAEARLSAAECLEHPWLTDQVCCSSCTSPCSDPLYASHPRLCVCRNHLLLACATFPY